MAEQAGELAVRGGARGDLGEGAIDLGAVRIDGAAAMSAIDRSLGPTKTPSIPGVARIASSEASASRVSIIAIASVTALALCR